MAGFVEDRIRVTVPATSANLGPGFDSLGLALSLRDAVEAQVVPSGLEIEVAGPAAATVPRDQSNLVVRALHAALEGHAAPPSGLRLRCQAVIPHGRGLGSSAAATVAGLVLGRALVGGSSSTRDHADLLQLAAAIEGHPDNVAPALLGGFVISGRDDDRFFAVPSPVDPSIRAVAFVSPSPVPTSVARGMLPATVPHADAAANAARSALLVAALVGRPELLLTATADRLHQDYREAAMPGSLALVRRLRGDGHAAFVSGAGPSVLVLTAGPSAPDAVTAYAPEGWTVSVLDVARQGAAVG